MAHTIPFTDGVYLEGALLAGGGDDAVAQFWPTVRSSYFTGFDGYADAFKFRPHDDALFYHDHVRGILKNGHSANASDDVVQLTPPCGDDVAEAFGFDADGSLYYRCADTLRRGNGELIARSITELAGVLADGRSIVTHAAPVDAPHALAYSVLSVDGTEQARFYPAELFTGALTLLPSATTVRGKTAYVLLARSFDHGEELIVYQIDPDSRFRLVRRAGVSDLGVSQLVVSDGTIFVKEYDPVSSGDQRIRAYLSSGSSRVVWWESEAVYVGSSLNAGLLTGRAR